MSSPLAPSRWRSSAVFPLFLRYFCSFAVHLSLAFGVNFGCFGVFFPQKRHFLVVFKKVINNRDFCAQTRLGRAFPRISALLRPPLCPSAFPRMERGFFVLFFGCFFARALAAAFGWLSGGFLRCLLCLAVVLWRLLVWRFLLVGGLLGRCFCGVFCACRAGATAWRKWGRHCTPLKVRALHPTCAKPSVRCCSFFAVFFCACRWTVFVYFVGLWSCLVSP